MTRNSTSPLDLEQTGSLVAGHIAVEEALFRTIGAWSTDPASARGPAGAGIQAFFAAESALHAWRAEQWELRLPRSVDARPDEGADAWHGVVGSAVELEDGVSRLALWALALAPCLAARYASHRAQLGDAADAGNDRWLAICISDTQRGSLAGLQLLGRCGEPDDLVDACAGAAPSAARLLPT